jgi:hypothetical protein
MFKRKTAWLFIVIVCGWGHVLPGWTQYVIQQSVFGNGGAVLSSAGEQMMGTVGQVLIGRTQNTSYTALSGFWYQTGPILTDVETNLDALPREFRLEQNYPNPFNPTTIVRFAVPKTSHVRLTLYDMLGRRVATLIDEEKPAGEYEFTVDAKHLSSGIYFYMMQAGAFTQTRKFTLVR